MNIRNIPQGSGESSGENNSGPPELERREEILKSLRTSEKFANLSDLELELLCVCAYVKPNMIPEQLLLNYSQNKVEEIKVGLKNLQKEQILLKHDDMDILSISNLVQKELRNLITKNSTLPNEEAVLEKILKILISEESKRKEGNFPYSGYIQDIILTAIGVWEFAFRYKRLVEIYCASLENIAIASHEEVSSNDISTLFFSKIVRQLSILFGYDSCKTLSLKLCMSYISAKNGKVNKALEEIDAYIKVIKSSTKPDVKFLLCNALEKKVHILISDKKYRDALDVCDMILDLNIAVNKIDPDELLKIKHLKCKILIKLGQLDEALELCRHIITEAVSSTILSVEDVKCTEAKILHSKKEYKESLSLIDSVIEKLSFIYNSKHSSVLDARTLKAETLEDMGQYDQAVTELNAVLNISEEKYGLLDKKCINTRASIARLLVHKGNKKEASTMINQMLEGAQNKFGNDSREANEIINFKEKIMNTSQQEDNHTEEMKYYETYRKYYIDRFNLQPNVGAITIAKHALGKLVNGNYEEALEDATSIYESMKRDLGEDCPGLEQLLDTMREAHNKLKHLGAELDVLQKLYRLRMILYGDKKSVTVNTLLKLADIQNSLNCKVQALVSYETLYKNIVNIKGRNDDRVFGVLKKITDLQLELDQHEDAIKSYEDLKQIMRSKQRGAEEELEVTYNIALCHLKCARIEEASVLCKQLMKDYFIVYSGKIKNNNKYQNLNNFVENLHVSSQLNKRSKRIY